MLIYASFGDRFWKEFWFFGGSTFEALGDQKTTKMSSKIGAKIDLEKTVPRTSGYAKSQRAGGQEGGKGGGKPPRWELGGSEEKKKGSQKEIKKGKFEDLKKVLHALTRRV